MNDKIETAIKQVSNVLAQKDVVSIELVGTCNAQGIMEVKMNNPPILNKNVSHKISMTSFTSTSFFPNLTESNNKFYYRNGTDTADKVVTVDTGGYDISDYYEEIKTAMIANNDDPQNLVIQLVPATGKVRITLKNGYKVYFYWENTWRDVLGFGNVYLTTDGVHTSTKVARVVTTEKVYAKCNLCTGTIFNGETSNILFSFINSKKYGAKLVVEPMTPSPRKLVNTNIDKVRLEFIDEGDNPVTFLQSAICIAILIEQM